MTISEPNKIDIVATRPDSRVVRLVVSDHLEWDDVQAHCRLLQNKLNTYLEFVEGGELARLTHPPVPADPAVLIEVALLHAPPPEAQAFLAEAGAMLHRHGYGFEWRSERQAAG